jgi:tRNA 2-thiouridine synthesizing protein E
LPLLRQSRVNHLGTLMFQWLYWHVLPPGQGPGGNSHETEGRRTMTLTEVPTPMPETDAEGFLLDPQTWDERLAVELAHAAGVGTLTDRHWQVVRFMRETYLRTGTAPSIRALGKESGVAVKELYELFPKGPAKLAAKIGGIPKPRGCI